MGKSKKGGPPKGDQKPLRPGGVPPPTSPPDDLVEWKPFKSGLKDSFYPPSDDDPNSSPSSSGKSKDDKINDINLNIDNLQGSGVDTLKRFQPEVRDKNIKTACDTFQQFTTKIPEDLEEFVDTYSFLNTLDPSRNNVQAIRTCLQESSFSLFCSYTKLMMTEGLQDVDELTKAQVSMLDIDTSSFTENNESLKLSLQQADKDFVLFCKFEDTLKWRIPIDFKQYYKFLGKDDVITLLSNRTNNVAGFSNDTDTVLWLTWLTDTVPTAIYDHIRQFMLAFHLQRIFVELFELNQLDDPTSGHGLFLKTFLVLGFDTLAPFFTMNATTAKVLLTSFAQQGIPTKMWIYPFALQALLFDLFKHVTARAHAKFKTPVKEGYSFLKSHCTSKQYRKYRKQYCTDNDTPTVMSWAHYHIVFNVYCQDIVTNFDDYETLSITDTGHSYPAIGSWTDDKKGHFVYCKHPVTDSNDPIIFFLSYQDAHDQFNNGQLLSMPRAYPYSHHTKSTQTFQFPSNDPLTYSNFTGGNIPTTAMSSPFITTRYVPKGFQKKPAPSGSETLPPVKPISDPHTVPPPDPRRMPTPWSQSARGFQPSYPAPVETPQGQYFPYPPVDPNVNPVYYVPPIHTSPHTGFPGLQTPSPMFHNTHNVRTGTFFPDQLPDYALFHAPDQSTIAHVSPNHTMMNTSFPAGDMVLANPGQLRFDTTTPRSTPLTTNAQPWYPQQYQQLPNYPTGYQGNSTGHNNGHTDAYNANHGQGNDPHSGNGTNSGNGTGHHQSYNSGQGNGQDNSNRNGNNGTHYNQPRTTSSYPNYSGFQSSYPGGHGHGSGGSGGGGGGGSGNGHGQGYSKPSPDAVLLSSLQRGQKRDINAFPELNSEVEWHEFQLKTKTIVVHKVSDAFLTPHISPALIQKMKLFKSCVSFSKLCFSIRLTLPLVNLSFDATVTVVMHKHAGKIFVPTIKVQVAPHSHVLR